MTGPGGGSPTYCGYLRVRAIDRAGRLVAVGGGVGNIFDEREHDRHHVRGPWSCHRGQSAHSTGGEPATSLVVVPVVRLCAVCREPVDQSRGIIWNIDRAERRGNPRSGLGDVNLDLAAVQRQLGQTALVEAVAGTREVDRSRHVPTVFRSIGEGNGYQWVTLMGNFAPFLLPRHHVGSESTPIRWFGGNKAAWGGRRVSCPRAYSSHRIHCHRPPDDLQGPVRRLPCR